MSFECLKAVIFDLDGTLWDSREQLAPAWNRVLNRHPELTGRQVNARELRGYMGKTNEEIARLMFPNLPDEEAQKVMDECGDEELVYLAEKGGRLYPDLEEVLKKLAERYELYIASNCQDGYVQVFLEHHQLGGLFHDIIMSGQTGRPKGDNIRLLMERNRVKNGEAVYVGDTAGDQEAAAIAGIPFIYAGYGFGQAEAPDYRIDSLKDLINLLQCA